MELIRASGIYYLCILLRDCYRDSAAHRLADKLCQCCQRWLEGSFFLTVLCREGTVAKNWQDSAVCRLITAIINLPGALLHKLYIVLQPLLEGSFFCRLAFEMGNETAILESWVILLLWVIPFTLWNNAYSLMGFVLLLAVFYMRTMHRANARLDVRNIGLYPALMFLAVCLASNPLSSYPALSGRFLIYHISAALCVLVTVSAVRDGYDLQRLAAGGSICVLVSSLYGIWQRIQGVEVNYSYADMTTNAGMPGRVESFFDNPNTFAEVLMLLLPIVIALALGSRHLWSKLLAAGIAALGITALGMTYSRASWVGLACAAVVFVFLWKPQLLPLFFLICVAAIPLLPTTIYNRILTITNSSDTSTASRIPLIQAALALIRQSPVTGAGLGTGAVQEYIADYNLYHGTAPFVHSHNIYLQVWVETGLLGVVSFVGGMLWNIKRGAHTARHSLHTAARLLTCGSTAALCGAMVCGLADYLWNYPRVMCIFWFVFALSIAGIKVCHQETRYLEKNSSYKVDF